MKVKLKHRFPGLDCPTQVMKFQYVKALEPESGTRGKDDNGAPLW